MSCIKFAGGLLISFLLLACASSKKPPSQIVYRFDDNRYLELIGYNCEGALRYHDVARNINVELDDGVFSSYKIFTQEYIHPSEKYILIPRWEPTAFTISKDYGRTWSSASYVASSAKEFEVETDVNGIKGTTPPGREIKKIVVKDDQAFIMTEKGHLYMSSWPFEDPRILPGGPGIDYTFIDETKVIYGVATKGDVVHQKITPQSPGYAWGKVIFMKDSLKELTMKYKTNYQNLPDKMPEVKNYKGWNKMRCNYDAGR